MFKGMRNWHVSCPHTQQYKSYNSMMTTSFVNHELPQGYLKDITRDINKIVKRLTYNEAVAIYRRAREKLLDVSAWQNDPRLKEFEYTLISPAGEPRTGFAMEGDFIRYKSPERPDEFNWVKVERILEVNHNDWKSFAIRFRSIEHPGEFCILNDAETNTIIIERSGNKVVSYVHQHLKDSEMHQSGEGIFSRIRKMLTPTVKDNDTTAHNWETLIGVILE